MARNSVETKLSRRDFLKLSFWGSLYGLAASAGFNKAVEAAESLGAPEPEFQIPEFPHPGWAQPEGRTPFIDPVDGHKKFLIDAIWKQPLRRIARRVWTRQYAGSSNGAMKLGDDLGECIEESTRILTDEFPNRKIPLDAAIEGAMFAYALTHSHFASPHMKRAIVKAEIYPKDPKEQYELELEAMKNIPRVFPVEVLKVQPNFVDRVVRYDGHDRGQHFASHLFLGHQQLRSKLYRLEYTERMPDSLKLALSIARSPQEEAYLLSKLAGRAWEVKESYPFPKISEMRDRGPLSRTGLWDNFVALDFQANRLGALAGVALARPGITQKEVDRVLTVLNDSKVTEAVSHTPVPLTDMSFFEKELAIA